MGYPDTTEGFAVQSTKEWNTFKKQEFPLKKFEEHDVDVAIDACGVCASDIHTITGGWGDIPAPLCVGHEIIGHAVKVGNDIKGIKVGDRVGVGAQISADLTCNNCKNQNENYCPNAVDTYGSPYGPDGVIGQGGFTSHIRVNGYFAFKIPENIPTDIAAPMLCAGLTTYSPLVRLGCGPGKKVAIVGLGGLGHFAVMWAVALGAEVTVISHTKSKKDDALKMGAKNFIHSEDKDWSKKHQYYFDFMLCAANDMSDWNWAEYFSAIKVNGHFHNVALPNKPISLHMMSFASTGCYLGTSHLGNHQEMVDMLELASKQNIKSWVETIPISEEGCKQAVEKVKNHEARYRYTLVDFDKQFGKRY